MDRGAQQPVAKRHQHHGGQGVHQIDRTDSHLAGRQTGGQGGDDALLEVRPVGGALDGHQALQIRIETAQGLGPAAQARIAGDHPPDGGGFGARQRSIELALHQSVIGLHASMTRCPPGSGRSTAADQGDDLDRIALVQDVLRVLHPADQRPVDLHSHAGARQRQMFQELGNGGAIRELTRFGIHGEAHGAGSCPSGRSFNARA